MSKPCSTELALIYNLHNASVWHKEHCTGPCNVSIYQLKQAAQLILRWMEDTPIGRNPDELEEARLLVNKMELV